LLCDKLDKGSRRGIVGASASCIVLVTSDDWSFGTFGYVGTPDIPMLSYVCMFVSCSNVENVENI
jgi:hypothetical protein